MAKIIPHILDLIVFCLTLVYKVDVDKPMPPIPEKHALLSSQRPETMPEQSDVHYPVIMWHGMGDYYNSKPMERFKDLVEETIPGIFVHSIYMKETPGGDTFASVWGDAMTQVYDACEQIKALDIDLENGINLIGFSQGGLMVRALAQICDIKVHNVIAVGSPLNGFLDLPPCEKETYMCKKKRRLAKKYLYTDYMQENSIQAQYFRDVYQYDKYLEKSAFLKFINNEFVKDLEMVEKFTSIDKFVMVMFTKDETLVPKETAWFYDVDPKTGDLISFKNTDSYKNDLIGLQTLDKEKKIDFYEIDDFHLQMSDEDVIYFAKTYF